MAVLDRLVEIGVEIAEAAGRSACAGDDDGPQHDPGLTYSRAARAVRLTIALQQRLAESLEKQGRDEAAARRSRIGRLVDRVIEAECGEDYKLTGRAWERLTEEEALDQLAGRPVGEVVALICQDLGLSPHACAEVMAAWTPEGPAPKDLPPLGEVPDVVGGRGLQGADARDSALQPPSSASPPMIASPTPSALAIKPPWGEDQGAVEPEPTWATPDG